MMQVEMMVVNLVVVEIVIVIVVVVMTTSIRKTIQTSATQHPNTHATLRALHLDSHRLYCHQHVADADGAAVV